MEEVRRNPQIILFIDEIHTIIGAGAAEGAVDAANIIAGAGTGEMQVIGATTVTEYRRHIEKGRSTGAALPVRDGGRAERGRKRCASWRDCVPNTRRIIGSAYRTGR